MEEKFMRRAIELAKLGKKAVKTNPLVGAVIVKDNKIIAEGYHETYGCAHAEENAINKAKADVSGATIYVTLEPCSHFGKRPPCANLLIENKISKVIIGSLDPNPKVAGRGVEILKNAGIEVQVGLLEEDCKEINESFFTHILTQRPFVVMKTAMSLDGKIATYSGDSKWISCEGSRKKAHQMRADLDAIMVGINTVLKDDPSLNVRMAEGKDPIRIIVDSKLRIPLDARVLNLESDAITLIATTSDCDKEKLERLIENDSVKVLQVNSIEGRVDLKDLMDKLYQEKIGSILLEGGGTLNFEMLRLGLVDKVVSFIAPKIIGGKDAISPVEGQGFETIDKAIKLSDLKFNKIGQDLILEARICSQE